jgi:hypothetical protein
MYNTNKTKSPANTIPTIAPALRPIFDLKVKDLEKVRDVEFWMFRVWNEWDLGYIDFRGAIVIFLKQGFKVFEIKS